MVAAFSLFSTLLASTAHAEIEIDVDAAAINNHADQIGIWVNSNSDVYRSSLVNRLKELNVKSLRHGWAYGMMSETDPDTFYRSPCDSKVQSYIGYGDDCRIKETMPLGDIATLRSDLGAQGFAVVPTDLYNYTGTEDAELAAMDTAARTQKIIDNAVRWAEWGKQNGFQYFELGNENDLPGEMVDFGVGVDWEPEAYAELALAMAKAMRKVYPQAKFGINGGWGASESARTAWWSGIRSGAPDLLDYLDFIVIHKYEFGSSFELWSENLWEWGRVQADSVNSVERLFADLPIYITEVSGFQVENGYVPHYRSVMTTEMIGNLLLDAAIQHVQVWGTRWGNDLNIVGDSDELSALGNGMKAYTQFMQPVMFANGTDTSEGKTRYFAARNAAKDKMTLWLINHSIDSVSQPVSFNSATRIDAQYQLVSRDANPLGRNNDLLSMTPASTSQTDSGSQATIELAPVSVTVLEISTGGGSGTTAPPTKEPTSSPAPIATPTTVPTSVPSAIPSPTVTDAPSPTTAPQPTVPNGSADDQYDTSAYRNAALGQRAFLSSVLFERGAELAVDGNRDGIFANGSVTHSACQADDTLSIDLGSEQPVSAIRVSNRTDCCQEELRNFSINLVSDKLEIADTRQEPGSIGEQKLYAFDAMPARYVELRMNADNCLTIAELEVFVVNQAAAPTSVPPTSTPTPSTIPTPTVVPTQMPTPSAEPTSAPSPTTVQVGVTDLGVDENGNRQVELSFDESGAGSLSITYLLLLLLGLAGVRLRRAAPQPVNIKPETSF